MTDNVLEFAEEHGLGKLVERLPLSGDLALPNGGRARATLLLTLSGLWLVAARHRFDGLALDLLTHGDLRFEAGRMRDRLCVAGESVQIPAGRRPAVERLIALARFASNPLEAGRERKPSRLLRAPDELGRAWLARELVPHEELICWLPGANSLSLDSPLLGKCQVRPHLFMSDRRAAIVAWSSVGDVTIAAIDASAPQTSGDGARGTLRAGGHEYVSRRADAEAAHDAQDLVVLSEPKARLLEAARRTWLGRHEEKNGVTTCLALLHAAIEQSSQRARFARLFVLAEEARPQSALDQDELARAFGENRVTPASLCQLWTRWRFSAAAGSTLVRALLDLSPVGPPFALALQRRIYEAPPADEAIARDELRLIRFAVSARGESRDDARSAALSALLAPHGLEGTTPGAPRIPQAGLALQQIETMLSHPLARGQTSLVSGVQKIIALAPAPDQVALNDYCEALDPSAYVEAGRALAAARVAFGLPGLGGYVSRGKKSVGLRGYEGETPYILLGKAHLDPASPYFMSEPELFFALGAEALHLRLGQTRVTSNDLWAGAFAHTKGGMELLLNLLPLVKGIPLGSGVSKVLERVPEPALRRTLDTLIHFEKHRSKTTNTETDEGALSLVNEDLLTAHRLMQMSADRAGLVVCRDVRAALRGLLLARSDYRNLLVEISSSNLVDVLTWGIGKEAMRGDLIVRVAALLAFYQSDDYLTLCQTLGGAD